MVKILDWPKIIFWYIHTILQKTPNEFFDQPNSSIVGNDIYYLALQVVKFSL